MLTKVVKIDPKDYPFKKFNDEQAHLDTDELRHTIKPRLFKLTEDFKGQEHLYCDPSDLDANGKFYQCQHTLEAKKAGFNNPMEHYNAKMKKQKDDDDKRQKDKEKLISDQQETITSQAKQMMSMQNDIKILHGALNDLINTINKNKISQ
jgi:hypothetical protein